MPRTKISQALICLLSVWALAAHASTDQTDHTELTQHFDSSSFATLDVQESDKNLKVLRQSVVSPDHIKGAPEETLSNKVIDIRIKSFSTLIKLEKDPVQKSKLLITRAVLYLKKFRNLREKKSSSAELESREQKLLEFAADDANKAKSVQKSSPVNRAYAAYLYALSVIDLNRLDDSISALKESLRLSPGSAYAPAIVLYLGEYYYENDLFADALELYQFHLGDMTADQKIEAQFKMAWCYISLKQLDKAQDLFVVLTRDPKSGEAGRDSIRELAHLATKLRDEEGLVTLSQNLFSKDKEKRTSFLSSAYSSLKNQNGEKKAEKLFAELMRIAEHPEDRLRLWLDEIRHRRKPYASKAQFLVMKELSSELDKNFFNRDTSSLKNLFLEINMEADQLVQSYVSTYAKRTRNFERLSQNEMGNDLKSIFEFYDRYFKNSKNHVSLFHLWLDVCADLNDFECLNQTSTRILTDATLSELQSQAEIQRIVALDSLSKQNPTRFRTKLLGYLEAFASKKDSSRWVEFMNRLADLYVEDKHFEKATPLLQSVYEKVNSEDAFFRVEWVRFQAGNYQEVIDASSRKASYGTASSHSKVADLVRESSLKLAIHNGNQGGNFSKYEENIDRFMKLNHDGEKEAVVMSDYLERLIERHDLQAAADKLLRAKPQLRRHSKLVETTRKLAVTLMSRGDFSRAEKILSISARPLAPELRYERVLAQLGSRHPVPNDEFDRLDDHAKEYLFGIFVVTKPEKVVQYITMVHPSSSVLRKYGFLALQVMQHKHVVSISPSLQKALGDAVPEELNLAPLQSEKMATKIKFPTAQSSQAKQSAMITHLMSSVRNIRHQVSEDIKGKAPEVKMRLLKMAAQLETKMASTLEKSIVPKGLNQIQVQAYQQGLSQVALEFKKQAKSFTEAQTLLADSTSESSKKGDRTRMPASLPGNWPWPQKEIQSQVFALMRDKNPTAALMMIDLAKSLGTLNESERMNFRAGILLSEGKNEPLQDFVYQELSTAGREDLIKIWKSF